ncbi:unnamed protein product [Paramecium sonneborni]|uniref:Uncharacterized protein n=1 Tax=Paramecium sonneborni TaxID=65129 RepID=A0A8S1NHV3_9CILI|nr:unnamed protein product [Paramecium sonneborni]
MKILLNFIQYLNWVLQLFIKYLIQMNKVFIQQLLNNPQNNDSLIRLVINNFTGSIKIPATIRYALSSIILLEIIMMIRIKLNFCHKQTQFIKKFYFILPLIIKLQIYNINCYYDKTII